MQQNLRSLFDVKLECDLTYELLIECCLKM